MLPFLLRSLITILTAWFQTDSVLPLLQHHQPDYRCNLTPIRIREAKKNTIDEFCICREETDMVELF
jgi:hypothetical protein